MQLRTEDGWEYLGDGVYFNDREYGVELATYDGFQISNRICLEPEHIRELARRVDRERPEAVP
jgi:hypothetical protein